MEKQRKQWQTIFWGSKFTADGECSCEIKRCLLLGRQTMTNQKCALKSRDITSLTNVCLVKAKVFPVFMYEHESWTINKAEHWRIDAFELRCWRLLSVPWTARRWNQLILKEINPEYLLEGLMLKLKLLILWPPDVKSQLIEKDPDAGKNWRQEEKGMTEDEMVAWHHQLDGHVFEWGLGVDDRQGSLECCSPWGHRVGHNWATELNWTESPSAVILEPPKIKSLTVSIVSPSMCHEVMGPNAMILVLWMLSLSQLFQSPLSFSSRGSLVLLHFLP